MKAIVIASLEDNEATLKSIIESGAIKVSESIQCIKIDRAIADVCADDSEKNTRSILTIIGMGG